jgi:hypothetical protein
VQLLPQLRTVRFFFSLLFFWLLFIRTLTFSYSKHDRFCIFLKYLITIRRNDKAPSWNENVSSRLINTLTLVVFNSTAATQADSENDSESEFLNLSIELADTGLNCER